MHLELMRNPSANFPRVANPDAIRTMRIWHCKFKTLAPLSSFVNLEVLEIATFPDGSFDALSGLLRLRHLSVLHMPNISALNPLEPLQGLESLSLATSPAWDAAKKFTIVDSLEPIARIHSIRHLELLGVRPQSGSLAPLLLCKELQSARFSQYPVNEVRDFYATSGVSDAFNPKAVFDTESYL